MTTEAFSWSAFDARLRPAREHVLRRVSRAPRNWGHSRYPRPPGSRDHRKPALRLRRDVVRSQVEAQRAVPAAVGPATGLRPRGILGESVAPAVIGVSRAALGPQPSRPVRLHPTRVDSPPTPSIAVAETSLLLRAIRNSADPLRLRDEALFSTYAMTGLRRLALLVAQDKASREGHRDRG